MDVIYLNTNKNEFYEMSFEIEFSIENTIDIIYEYHYIL